MLLKRPLSIPEILRWADIDREHSRFTVRSAKTAHHEGKDRRVVPIFPELLPYLADAFDRAEPGQEYVITHYRDSNVNLRTQFMRIIRRAGEKPWPKLFHNLRASRETELAAEYPIHVVCEWIGNTTAIAAKHYLTVREENYERAAAQGGAKNGALEAHFPAQKETAPKSKESHKTTQAEISKSFMIPVCRGDYLPFVQIPPRGVGGKGRSVSLTIFL